MTIYTASFCYIRAYSHQWTCVMVYITCARWSVLYTHTKVHFNNALQTHIYVGIAWLQGCKAVHLTCLIYFFNLIHIINALIAGLNMFFNSRVLWKNIFFSILEHQCLLCTSTYLLTAWSLWNYKQRTLMAPFVTLDYKEVYCQE